MKRKHIVLIIVLCLFSYTVGFAKGQASAYRKMEDNHTYVDTIMRAIKK